ncbi:MAG: hypothetical protein ACLFOY_09115 [Desulfatibacillaceae bacterium]
MAEKNTPPGQGELPRRFMTKKCPYCSTTLGYDETLCIACKNKVGEANENGIATKPGAWKAYVSFGFALCLLGGYIYWFFLR